MTKKAILLIVIMFILTPIFADKESDYITGQELKLKLKVNIWGQVRSPGEYIVEDGTNIIGLISLAGGPTDYANLKKVKIIRHVDGKKQIIKIDIKKFVDSPETMKIPELKPGDVVIVPKSIRADWNMMIQILSQIAIILNVIYIINRDKD